MVSPMIFLGVSRQMVLNMALTRCHTIKQDCMAELKKTNMVVIFLLKDAFGEIGV